MCGVIVGGKCSEMDVPYTQTFKRSLSNNIYIWFFLTVLIWYFRATDTMALWVLGKNQGTTQKDTNNPLRVYGLRV